MTSNPPGDCCASGFRHEGTPTGEIKTINGVKTYFAYPKETKSPEKAILYLSDAWGLCQNSQLLADQFAKAGYLTILPDIFGGDPITLEDMNKGKEGLSSWVQRHPPDVMDPIVESSIKYLREELGISRLGTIGYCLGGKYVGRFLREGKADVGYMGHPSLVTQEELSAINGPLSIAAAETDEIFPAHLRHHSEDILVKTKQPYQLCLYGGVAHGFASRCDLNVPYLKFAKEQAYRQAVAWFDFHL